MGRAARQRRGRSDPQLRGRSVPPAVIGVDIGGVLVDRVAESSDTSFFGDRPMDTPAVAGAIEGLAALAVLVDFRIHIVSKAGPKISERSRRWLASHGVFDGSSVPASNVAFVRKRADKHPICERLQITHFIDDRLDVLEHLVTVPNRYLFIGGLGRNEPPTAIPPAVQVVPTWPVLVDAIGRNLERRASNWQES